MQMTPKATKQAFALRVGRMTDDELRAALAAARADADAIQVRVIRHHRVAPMGERHRSAIAALRAVRTELDVLTLAAERRGVRV